MKYFLMSVFMLTTHIAVGYYGVLPVFHGSFQWWTIPVLLLLGGIVMVTFLLGIVYFHISSQPVSKFHTLSSALLHYVFEYGMLRSGRAAMKKLQIVCDRPREFQEVLLRNLLKENRDTVYGKKYGFAGIKNLKDFQAKHPLTEYEHYRSYIEAIARGEEDVLSSEPPKRLSLTSGTTGEAKLVPIGNSFMQKDYTELGGMVSAVAREAFPDWDIMRRRVWLYCNPTMGESKSGIPIGPLSAIPDWARNLLVIYATPGEGFRIGTEYESTYIHLLFGLRDPGVSVLLAGFSTSLLTAMRLLEDEWEQIVEDLASGEISPRLNLAPEIRVSLEKALGTGDPRRAEALREEFEEGFDGIIRRVWPDIAYITSIDIANLKDMLSNSYAEGVPMYGHCYGATEGILGLNTTPLEEEEEYLLLVDYTIFEFIPEKEMSKSSPKTYFIDEVKVGQNYEIVVTVHAGLYRFRFGDVVQVTGFFQECPKVKFLYRLGALLNIRGEKMNQAVVHESLEYAIAKVSGTELVYYAVAESTLLAGSDVNLKGYGDSETKPHYVFFLELEHEENEDEGKRRSKPDLPKLLDASLCRHHHVYKLFKGKGQLGNPHVLVVPRGGFSRLHGYILENSSATANQLKMPQKLRTTGMVEFMLKESGRTAAKMAEET